MSKFKKSTKKGITAINTASLPDIIFMLLFFFMVTTVMREVSLNVRVSSPSVTEAKKLEKKSLVSNIYIGPPTKTLQAMFGTEPRIQLNDKFEKPSSIREFISQEREGMAENDRMAMTVSLKIDKETKMGIVTEVKQELRKASALKINYSARRELTVR